MDQTVSYLVVPPCFHIMLSELVRMIFINVSHRFSLSNIIVLSNSMKETFIDCSLVDISAIKMLSAD